MIGRAGRPGFDTEGTAVIMTDNKSKAVFQRLASSGLESAKSQLATRLDEIMNTEISQGVITSLESALNWMKGTLYFEQLNCSFHDRESHVLELCRATIARLSDIGALQLSSPDYSIQPLSAGRIMVRAMFEECQPMECVESNSRDPSESKSRGVPGHEGCSAAPIRCLAERLAEGFVYYRGSAAPTSPI